MRIQSGMIVVAMLLTASAARAEILTLFSDNGIPASPAFTVPVYSGNNDAVALGTATDITSPEGLSSWRTYEPVKTYAGWGLAYAAPQDFSRFDHGELRFWAYTNSDIEVSVKNAAGAAVMITDLSLFGWTPAMANRWIQYRLPIASLLANSGVQTSLTGIVNPFLFTQLTGGNTFYIDDVRYVDSTSIPIFDISLRNRGTNTPTSVLDWGNVNIPPTSPGGWTMAPQYLQFEVDPETYPWGIQIYTDNTAADANPHFQSRVRVGQPGSDPAGLVDTSTTTVTIPLAWAVRMDASTTPPVAADPNDSADPNSWQWFFVKDAATPAIAPSATTAFSNGDPYITVKNNMGIHFAQDPASFGAQNPPNVIYFETNLGPALGGRSYKTSTLRVEFYYP